MAAEGGRKRWQWSGLGHCWGVRGRLWPTTGASSNGDDPGLVQFWDGNHPARGVVERECNVQQQEVDVTNLNSLKRAMMTMEIKYSVPGLA